MSEPMVGEIKILPYTFTPQNYLSCTGQLIEISQFQVLFAVISVIYGGDGRTTFATPNFQGRAPVGQGQAPGLMNIPQLGYMDGFVDGIVTSSSMPEHTHAVYTIKKGSDSNTPAGTKFLGNSKAYQGVATQIYTAESTDLNPMSSQILASYGTTTDGYSLHENMQPYQVLRYVIAYDGIFPSRN